MEKFLGHSKSKNQPEVFPTAPHMLHGALFHPAQNSMFQQDDTPLQHIRSTAATGIWLSFGLITN